MHCDDDRFDKYALEAADEVGEPPYALLAFPSTLLYQLLGARNCQSWVADVLNRAQEKYLANENCPKCFQSLTPSVGGSMNTGSNSDPNFAP